MDPNRLSGILYLSYILFLLATIYTHNLPVSFHVENEKKGDGALCSPQIALVMQKHYDGLRYAFFIYLH